MVHDECPTASSTASTAFRGAFAELFRASPAPDIARPEATSRASARLAAISVAPHTGGGAHHDDWLALCYRTTPRVECLSARDAVLDLGRCTEEEAVAAMRSLIARLARDGVKARSGIGPSPCLAQLVLLTAPTRVSIAAIGPDDAAALLHRAPIAVLTSLHPTGVIATEDIARMQNFGLRTLGQVARLGQLALRRQFGDTVGRFLFDACRGVEPHPFKPTPEPARLHLRLRIAEPVTPEQLLAALPRFSQQVAKRLKRRHRRARALRLDLRWGSGAIATASAQLREPTGDPRRLAQELTRLFSRCLATSPHGLLAELRLTLGDLAPASPEQMTFWPERSRRRAALLSVADALAKRQGHAVILTPLRTEPAAVFAEEGYRLAESREEGPGKIAHGAPVTQPAGDGDPWQGVPQRLHWW
jgi:DNA polymerase-4